MEKKAGLNILHRLIDELTQLEEAFFKNSSDTKAYNSIVNALLNLTKGVYASFNQYDTNSNTFTLVAHSWHPAFNTASKEIDNTLFFNNWSFISEKNFNKSKNAVSLFDTASGINNKLIPESISSFLYQQFKPKKAGIIKLKNGSNHASGHFLFFLSSKSVDIDESILHFFANQASLLLRFQEAREMLIQAQLDKQAANQAKSQFLGTMSDEIRTPLHGVIGFADLMMTTDLNEVQDSYMNNIIASAVTLMDLINDILDLSKIESGQLEINPELTDILELCNTIVNQHNPAAQKKGLNLSFDFSPNVPRAVIVDTVRLPQVLNNLLSNAVKFTEAGGIYFSVKVREIYPSSKMVKIEFAVKDTGIGISKNDLEKVFKVFSQVDASNRKKFGGTGLGLVVSKRIVEKMNGEISVDSSPGKGSTFSFMLPLSYDHEISAISGLQSGAGNQTPAHSSITALDNTTSDSRSQHAVNRGYYKILVAVADEVSLTLLNSIFENYFPNTLVIDVSNAKDARVKIKEHEFNLILLDLQTPTLNGYELIKEIRKKDKEKMKQTPVISLSTGVLRNEKKQCLNSGMNEYFLKPLATDKFIEALNQWLTEKAEQKNKSKKHMHSELTPDFNREAFLERCGGDREIANKMLKVSKKTFNTYIKNLLYYIDLKDFNMTKSWAHTIKGAALNMSFDAMAQKAIQINAMKEPDFETMKSLAQDIKLTYDRNLNKLTNF
jgi:signal transduction histidine kinase/CheY-like chemotaxis protein